MRCTSVEAWVSGMQVKVWLGTNADHYYILSRFLISRMLLVTKVLHFREHSVPYFPFKSRGTRLVHQY